MVEIRGTGHNKPSAPKTYFTWNTTLFLGCNVVRIVHFSALLMFPNF